MTDDTTPRILQAIQAKLGSIEEHGIATNRAIGNLAQSILQLRTAIDSQATDIRTMMLALGEQGAKLGSVENRLASLEERIGAIETQLRAPH